MICALVNKLTHRHKNGICLYSRIYLKVSNKWMFVNIRSLFVIEILGVGPHAHLSKSWRGI